VRSNRASELGHPCARYLTYNRVAWNQRKMHDVGLQYVFDEGNRGEKHAMEDLREAGYQVVEGQRAFSWSEKEITGSIDGKIFLPLGHPRPRAVPMEIKSINPYDWARLNTVEDLLTSAHVHLRKIPAQIITYLLLNATEELGALILRNKTNGQLKAIPVVLDYEMAEQLVAKAERVNTATAAIFKAGGIPPSGIVPATIDALLPERIPYDEEICGRCAFFHVCLPDQALTAPQLQEDPELLAMLRRREELKPASDEYERLTRTINDRFKRAAEDTLETQDAAQFVVGTDYYVTVTKRSVKEFTVQARVDKVVKVQRLGKKEAPVS
jgi:CRISPR/Cas system-associated exonuclease Cas4 (RecB family)